MCKLRRITHKFTIKPLKPSSGFTLTVCEFFAGVYIHIDKIHKNKTLSYMDRVKRIWYLSPMRAAKVQASLRRKKIRSLVPLNGWTCAVEIYHDGMLEDTHSLDGAHIYVYIFLLLSFIFMNISVL